MVEKRALSFNTYRQNVIFDPYSFIPEIAYFHFRSKYQQGAMKDIDENVNCI